MHQAGRENIKARRERVEARRARGESEPRSKELAREVHMMTDEEVEFMALNLALIPRKRRLKYLEVVWIGMEKKVGGD